jgi:glycosyltransferase involved in cell wall biosynthesis
LRDDAAMRIGIVCYPTVGGSGVVATEMAHALALRGHDVHLLSYDRPNRLRRGVPGLRFHHVAVTAYPLFRYPPYDLALATRMLGSARRPASSCSTCTTRSRTRSARSSRAACAAASACAS